MGFYGNITNTSNTTFNFDRIYPNRLEMDANVNNDGIFIGRYVLVEYDQDAAYPIIYTDGNKFYSSPNKEKATQIKFETSDGFFMNEIGQVQDIETDNNGNLIKVNSIKFYQCIGEDSEGYAIFKLFTSVNTDNKYIQNFAIDEKEFGNSTFKGYDSTVWMKSSVTASDGKLIAKYVNIADLNSVVPTFDIAADAPTMTPITPHFDSDSTNVYYKLHAQPQWGFRIAQTSADKSDETTQWVKDFYDPATDTSSKKYASGITNGIPNWDSENPVDLNAAIYFNEAAFLPQHKPDQTADKVNKHSTSVSENTIKIEATGKSGNEYNTHNGQNRPNKTQQIDTQELTINLPAIGNMMSDVWDIVHGKQRNDYRGDGEDASLQGRLDSFEGIETNQIPIKRNDGTIIGSKVNNGNDYQHIGDILDQTVLNVDRLEHDDPWIRVNINSKDLKGGTKLGDNPSQASNNGILIQHTFHSTEDSETSLNKNTGEASVTERQNHIHAIKDDNNNIIQTPINAEAGNKTDKIKLYTPYVDATGHVVGKNIETVILPYGYKTFTTNGRGNDTDDANDGEQSLQASVVADSTQDSLALNSGNKWVRIDTDANNDIITFSHDVHEISETDNDDTDLNDSTKYNAMTNGNTIIIPDWDFDNAGHITDKHNRTYTLPYGYKTIVANNSTAVTIAPDTTTDKPTADNTQDTLNLTASNKWIKFNTTDTSEKNEIQLGHLIQGETFGHTYYAKNSELLNNDAYKQIPNFGDDVQILNITVDNAGHITGFNANTIKIPNGDLTDATSNEADVITQLAFDKPTGHLTTTRTNIGALKLTGYVLPTQITNNGILSADTSLNENIGRLDFRLNKEVQDRKDAINALDVEDTIDDTKYVSGVSEIDGKITVSRAGTDTLKLSNYSMATSSSDVTNGDTINDAFGKIQKQIKDIYGSDKIAQDFDTIKEIADWLDANDSNADKIIDSIATLNGEVTVENSVANKIDNAINALDVPDTAVDGQYVSAVSEENGKISVERADLPTYTLKSGDTNGTVKFNDKEVAVKGLGSAAYTELSAYDTSGSAATAEQNAKDYADELAKNYATDTEFDYGEGKKTLIDIIADLQSRIQTLENIINNSQE